jgi:hypothetical protein
MKKLSGVAIWLMVFLVIWGIGIFQEYFSEHTYYYDMLKASDNRLLLFWWLVSAAIPLSYHALVDKPNTKWFVWSTIVAILFYAYAFIAVRDEFLGSAFLALPINIGLMIGGAVLMLGGMRSGGSMLYRKLYHQEADTLDRSVTALIFGFIATLVISWVLVISTLLYQIVAVACLVVCGYLILREKLFWRKLASNTSVLINANLWFDTWAKSLTTILFGVTIMYLCYGLMLSFIPYPTAWDANHAYMYIPKVWAEHHGYIWNSLSAQFSPSPWLTYIAVWFQFGYAFQSIGGWIWPDTWAVVMNFFSVLIVMIMTWGLVRRVIRYVNLTDRSGLYQTAWIVLLSWMTSGMGAFLVFVDNKSDFGILAITLCALILVFDWLPKLEGEEQDAVSMSKENSTLWTSNIQPIISGLVAAVAIFSKPTSLFDFASVVVLFAGVVAWAWAMVGTWLLVIGAMALMKITTVPLYVSLFAGKISIVIGVVLLLVGIATSGKNKITLWSRLIMWWVAIFWLLIVTKTPLMLWRNYHVGTSIGGAKWYVQGILMGYNWAESDKLKAKSNNWNNIRSLSEGEGFGVRFAQNTSLPAPTSCTLQSEWLTKDTLYDGTLKATSEWAGEDLGRYIGYGGKTWDNPWWWFLIPDDTCIALDSDARVLCDQRLAISQWQFGDLATALDGDALNIFQIADEQKSQWLSASYIQKDLTRKLTLYRQDKALIKSAGVVTVPYRWIVPLNMTYNRSLQNLSSYYTDIGVVWLVLLVILVTATIWLLVYSPRRAIIPLTAIIGWMIWWVSGSSILWYGIGLIIWTMLSMVIITDTWTDRDHISSYSRTLIQYVMALAGLIVLVQFVLNFIRIGSQWGWGVFVQYKTANGRISNVTDQLSIQPKIKYGLSGKDIFDMQFPHYNKTLNMLNEDPTSKRAVLIAGTYMPYFVLNQYNIIGDGFLTSMREWFSDQDICRSYLRLQDKNLEYLVIDPNIASVVMGDGNIMLRDRMFAKIDPNTGKIIKHGSISMLAKLVSKWYIELFNTNNIGAKYAFSLSDSEIAAAFGVSGDDDIALTRTKIATARFRGQEGNAYLQKVLQIMAQRVATPQGISDLADIFGKDVDVPKLAAIAQQVQSPWGAEKIKALNQDERYILANYLNLVNSSKSNQKQFEEQITSLLQQSIGGGSQLIVFKVRK